MSLWLMRRGKSGTRYVWIVDIPCLPFLFLAMFAIHIPVLLVIWTSREPVTAGLLAAGLMLAGLGCLAAAKASLFRRGVWRSWGPALMGRGWAQLYRAGYGLMLAGAALVIAVILAVQLW